MGSTSQCGLSLLVMFEVRQDKQLGIGGGGSPARSSGCTQVGREGGRQSEGEATGN